jgi:hypothetical protein
MAVSITRDPKAPCIISDSYVEFQESATCFRTQRTLASIRGWVELNLNKPHCDHYIFGL